MEKKNDGGAAYPHEEIRENITEHGSIGCTITEASKGMSLRDYFAGQALSGILSDKEHIQEVLDALKKSDSPKTGFQAIAQLTYLYSDEMIKVRNK